MIDEKIHKLLAVASGTLREVRAAMLHEHSSSVAEILLHEVAARSALFAAPPIAVKVQIELLCDTGNLSYVFSTGPSGCNVREGSLKGPWVLVRQDLSEFLQSVFGPGNSEYDSTRVVWIMSEQAIVAETEDWHGATRAANIAAGQILSACSIDRIGLDFLARMFGTDKWGGHFYTQHYERHLGRYRRERIRLLEIGVGGYADTDSGGESLRMWKYYFLRGVIYGIDLFDKSALDDLRICTIKGDQSDSVFLQEVGLLVGPIDIIIDDGSHISSDVITSFISLFPSVSPGGVYVIEDLQTSYWPTWSAGVNGAKQGTTSIEFLKAVVDGLHYQETPGVRQDERLAGLYKNIRAVHFYHNIAFIEKGASEEQRAPLWIPR